ncbi:hypothetical protein, partial [Candidatus Venteria ishoeyi]|uniref:hypothetical protein n=1 Tax=Candidatus Venteria ishoeyi TaxID=1899563 RepID=UPI0011B012E7
MGIYDNNGIICKKYRKKFKLRLNTGDKMRHSKRDEKRQKRSRIIMGLITIIVMVGGGVGIFASNVESEDNALTYNDINFKATPNGWLAKINGEKMYFNVHPSDLDQI